MSKIKPEIISDVLTKLREGFSLNKILDSDECDLSISEFNDLIKRGDDSGLGFNLGERVRTVTEERSMAQLEKAVEELEDNKMMIEPVDRVKIRLNIAKLQADFVRKNTPDTNQAQKISIKDIEKSNKKKRTKLGV